MFEIISQGFQKAKTALTGQSVLTESNIQSAVQDIRVSLLEADVAISVVRSFIDRVKQRAIGEVIQVSVKNQKKQLQRTPADHFIFICQQELTALMGPAEDTPIVFSKPQTIMMMVGLQGTGKTTTCGKLAKWLLRQKRKPLLVAADIYRPAAVTQLKILGETLKVPVFHVNNLSPEAICQQSLQEAQRLRRDVVILDTAGRLAIDEALMAELQRIKTAVQPHHTFLVCDAMAGQDTVETANRFHQQLQLNGIIMTKLDGDARGGAALSIKQITGQPIKFLGMGETLDKLEPFHPEGLASRILGMGDIVSLMHDFEQVISEKEAEKEAKKMLKGHFGFEDFLKQLEMIQKLGPIKNIYEKFPGFSQQNAQANHIPSDQGIVGMRALIQSMTPRERQDPQIIEKSRRLRITKGSGRKPEELEQLIQRFTAMQQMMAGISQNPSMLASLPGFQQLGQLFGKKGGLIPGMPKNASTAGRLPALGLGQNPGAQAMPNLSSLAGGGMPPGMDSAALENMAKMAGIDPSQLAQMSQAMQGSAMPGQATMGAAFKAQSSSKDKHKLKNKRKAERQARKKSRR